VVADIDDENVRDRSPDPLDLAGVHTELRLPRRRRGQRNSISADMLAAVRQLVLIANDDLIAGILNRNGLVTGHGNRWTRERVSALRSRHKIPVFRPAPDGNEPWLNLNKAAGLLGIAPKTLRLAVEAGEIEASHPLPDGPWIFSRSTLGAPRRTHTSSTRYLGIMRKRPTQLSSSSSYNMAPIVIRSRPFFGLTGDTKRNLMKNEK